MLVLVCAKGNSQVDQDKALHFLGGNLYGLAGAGIAKQISKGNRWWTFAGAIGGSTLIGLGKEAVDAGQRPNGWDNDDLLATILGGATIGVTIDLFTNHKKKKQRDKKLAAAEVSTLRISPGTTPSLDFKTGELPSMTELGLSASVFDELR